jgi:hypothetical protein
MRQAHLFPIILLAAAAPLAALPFAGCVDTRPEASRPCPCASGTVCCASGVCAPDGDSCGEATLGLAIENAGTWTGYLENYNLPSGSDALAITLDVSGPVVSGTFVMGTAAAPPPPTDITIPWPPGSPPITTIADSAGPGLSIPDEGIVEGVAYEARDIVWENLRLKFKVALGDAWRPLCDLYAANPITVAGETVVCPASWGWQRDVGCTVGEAILSDADCQHVLLVCASNYKPTRCVCDETTCTPFAGDLSVDVALHDNRGDGSVAGAIKANVRLTRAGR